MTVGPFELIALFLLINVAFGLIAARDAGVKGYTRWPWVIGGFLFGVLAVIVAAVLPLHARLR